MRVHTNTAGHIHLWKQPHKTLPDPIEAALVLVYTFV